MAKNEDIKFFLKSTKEHLLMLHHSVCGIIEYLEHELKELNKVLADLEWFKETIDEQTDKI